MKKIKSLLLCTLLPILLLSGCRLAKPEAGEAPKTDRLIGVFITWDYLDLFDFEAYFNDNANKIINGGAISPEESKAYDGRIYAALKTETITRDDGTQFEHGEFVFEGLDGIPFFMPYITSGESESYWSATASPEISDTKVVVGNRNSLEGTLYVTPQGPRAMYLNPVYQEGSGRVYLTSGSGVSHGGDISEGTSMSSTLSETHNSNENGVETEESITIKINLSVKNAPETVAFLEMDDQSGLITAHRYKPSEVPESLRFGADTAYVIVESRSRGSAGEIVAREILSPDTAYYASRYGGEDGILQAIPVSLSWESGQ